MRPKGWDNPWDKKHWELDRETLTYSQTVGCGGRSVPSVLLNKLYWEFETGADTMVESLLKDGIQDIIWFEDKGVTIKLKTIIEHTCKRGTWIFIEEE